MRPSTTEIPRSETIIMLKIAVNPIKNDCDCLLVGGFWSFGGLNHLYHLVDEAFSGFTVTFAVKVSLTILEPPMSVSPGALRTGTDSPVKSDSSTMAMPSSTSASRGLSHRVQARASRLSPLILERLNSFSCPFFRH